MTLAPCPFKDTKNEGWALFDNGINVNVTPCDLLGVVRIECTGAPDDGSDPIFDGDEDAWAFVVDRALAGSLMHKSALWQVSDSERELIGKHVGVITLFLAMKLDTNTTTTVGETL